MSKKFKSRWTEFQPKAGIPDAPEEGFVSDVSSPSGDLRDQESKEVDADGVADGLPKLTKPPLNFPARFKKQRPQERCPLLGHKGCRLRLEFPSGTQLLSAADAEGSDAPATCEKQCRFVGEAESIIRIGFLPNPFCFKKRPTRPRTERTSGVMAIAKPLAQWVGPEDPSPDTASPDTPRQPKISDMLMVFWGVHQES